jgi:site-specific recombinase XerD
MSETLPVPTGHSRHLLDWSAPTTNLLPAYLERYDRPETRRAYRNDLVSFFGTAHVSADLARAASFLHINQHILDLESAGARPSTIKRRVAAIRGFFDWALALELIPRNPANKQLLRRVRSSRTEDRSIVFLTSEQASALLDATEAAGNAALRDRALLQTLLHCVLRRSEAAAMDVAHVRPLGHYWIVDLPRAKGGADQYVKIPAHVVEEIDAMKRHYGIASGPLWRSLSNRTKDARLSAHGIYQIVRRTAQRAALPEIGAHALRHTGCTLAIEAGATLQQVQAHARHKQIQTTMTYLHQRDRLRDSAADYIHIKK